MGTVGMPQKRQREVKEEEQFNYDKINYAK